MCSTSEDVGAHWYTHLCPALRNYVERVRKIQHLCRFGGDNWIDHGGVQVHVRISREQIAGNLVSRVHEILDTTTTRVQKGVNKIPD